MVSVYGPWALVVSSKGMRGEHPSCGSFSLSFLYIIVLLFFLFFFYISLSFFLQQDRVDIIINFLTWLAFGMNGTCSDAFTILPHTTFV
jgi:hypothetical protein